MQCYSPVLSTTTIHGRIWLPCGKCEACKQRTGKDWFIRLLKHFDYQSFPSYFVTLTYRTECIPIIESEDGIDIGFDKPSLQLLLKQIRNFVNQGIPKAYIPKNYVKMAENSPNPKISYFAIAERGDLRNRPHYHILLFNVPWNKENTQEIIEKLWNKGIVHIGDVNEKSICYITDYCVTKDDENTEWRIMSQHIGADYVKKFRQFHKSKQEYKVPVYEKSYNMPRYMRDKIFTESEKLTIRKKIAEEIKNDKNDHTYYDQLREDLRKRIKFKKEKRLHMKQLKLKK